MLFFAYFTIFSLLFPFPLAFDICYPSQILRFALVLSPQLSHQSTMVPPLRVISKFAV